MNETDLTEWLSLKEASDHIGVHPTTLRRWADAGMLPCTRTAGGHRRFQKSDLETYLATTAEDDLNQSEAETKVPVTENPAAGDVEFEAMMRRQWHAPFVEAQVVNRMRELGQRLLGLLIQYMTRSEADERFLKEGREVGYGYGYECYEANIVLLDAVEAFLYFRVNFSETTSHLPATARVTDGPESIRLHKRIDQFMNAVLLGLIAAYEDARGHTKQRKDS